MAVDSDANEDQSNAPMMQTPLSEVPLSDGGDTSPAAILTLEEDQIPCDGGTNSQTANPSQIDSPFCIQGALDVGQPLDQWDYYSTTDNLEECGIEDDPVYVPDRGFDRYYPALRQLAPIRFVTKRDRKVLPVDSVGLFSFATFSWMTNFMWKLFRKGAFTFEAYRCSFMESCNINSQRFDYLWGEELKRRGPRDASVFCVSWRFIRTRVTLATLLYTINLFGGLLTPMYFLPALVENARKSEPSYYEGSAYAIAILLIDSLRGFIVSLHGAITLRTALRLRSAILTLVYRKVISLNSLGQANTGQILNLFSNDSQRLLEFGQVLHMWLPGLLTVIASFSWLVWELEWAGATGVAAFMLFFFVQYAFAKATTTLKGRAVAITDGRVQKTREILSAIKVIKVNAWEDVFFKIISKLRLDELRVIQKIVFFQFMTGAFSNCLPALTTVITFMTCIALGYNLTAAQSFSALGVLGWSRYGLVFLPVSFGAIAQTKVTMNRVKEVLLQEDTRPCVSIAKDPNHAVCVTNATFGWDFKPSVAKSVDDPGCKNKKSGVVTRTVKQSSPKTEEIESLAKNSQLEVAKIVDVLFDLNLAVTKGQLVGICGPVGSGKSSLLSAVLSQMHLRRGDLAFRGNFAYLPQQPWLMNATLRQNIVFADAFNAKRYYGAIHSCCLNDDLSALVAGDQTEVGESGTTLSGGQQQRVALARAVYADRDIYLLDDPFSSLDGVVSDHVFQNCIRGALSCKTILLVTCNPQFLSQCDCVVVLREGSIAEQGTPSELMAREGYLNSLLQTMQKTDSVGENDKLKNRKCASVHNGSSLICDVKAPTALAVNAGRLTRAEEKGSGSVSWRTYAAYVQAMGGVGVAVLVTACVIIFSAVIVYCGWWMGKVIHNQQTVIAPLIGSSVDSLFVSNTTASNVSNVQNATNIDTVPLQKPIADPSHDELDDVTIQVWCAVIVVTILVTSVLQAYLFSKAAMAASRRLHDSILDKVFHGTMRFFEVTPLGRILNVFSKDLDEVDCILPTMLNTCQVMLWSTVFFLLSVVIIFPLFILSLPILLIIFAYTLLLFSVTAREVKRRENASRSPFFGHVNTTLNGLTSLHAYEKEKLFEREFVRLQDDNSALTFLLVGSIRWMSVRMDFIVALSSSLVAFFIVFMHGQIAPSFAAMALIYCSSTRFTLEVKQLVVQLSNQCMTVGDLAQPCKGIAILKEGTIPGSETWKAISAREGEKASPTTRSYFRILTEAQARFTNVERIIRYENALEWEGAKRNSLPPAPHDWPSKGEISFENVDLRYREGLPLALNGVTFRVPCGKKVAIIGRTGSGKSSVGVALFRLVELQRGQILIDDLDISLLPLDDLRSRLSIIPQDPFLFKGTVRYNLDPLNSHVDEDIWQALAKVQLHEKIMGLDNQLSCSVAENGSNFSVGEKQLICLARALLRQSRVVFFDEAFASVDTETDTKIQSSISKSFVGCTVLSVVHRLRNIMSFDYVLVMNDSRLVEFGCPSELAERRTSLFSVLISSEQRGDAGFTSQQKLA